MGFMSTIMGVFGFGAGTCFGLISGYYFFIFFQSTDVKAQFPFRSLRITSREGCFRSDPLTLLSDRSPCDFRDPEIKPLAELDGEALGKLLPDIPLWVKNPDFHRVDWLNNFIQHMWPYLDKAICKTAREISKPIIDEQLPKYRIQAVDFQKLTLGTLPPTFQGMKVYMTEEKELIMEPVLRWAGNPNILVRIKAFGLRASVQVVDLQVFTHPRITLKPLVPAFPCFAKIFVSLMEKPHVDFGLKLFGADAMAIPGLYRTVQEIITGQIGQMYLWPKTLEIPILDPKKAGKRPVGILHIKVVRAINLRKKDLIGASDPYVKLKISGDRVPSKKTAVKFKNLNPEWNEDFNVTIRDPESQVLEVSVYDYETIGKPDKMGMNVVPVKDLIPEETKELTLNLLKNMDSSDVENEKSRGQLALEVTYKQFKSDETRDDVEDSGAIEKAPEGTPVSGGVLVIIIHQARDVEGKHHTNPYVELLFRGEEKKTKTVKKNRDPRFDEEFSFTLDEPPTEERIHVEVFSVSSRIGLLHPKESLGYVDISLRDVISNRRINQSYNLIESKNGRIQIELQWRTY